jgi:hypothetical protein
MSRDVLLFLVLFSVFLFSFASAFYVLLREEEEFNSAGPLRSSEIKPHLFNMMTLPQETR